MNKKSTLSSWFSKKRSSSRSITRKQESPSSPTFLKNAAEQKSENTIQIEINFKNKFLTKVSIDRNKAAELTTDWLLYKVKQNFKVADNRGQFTTEISRIVALKTTSKSIALDYWLTLPGKDLSVMPDKVQLKTVISNRDIPSEDNLDNKTRKYGLEDFEICGLLGQGAFAKVYLARKKDDGKFYAIKQIQKRNLDQKGKEGLLEEKNNLLRMKNSRTIQLYLAFQTENYCYLVTKYCPAGDLKKLSCMVGPMLEEEAKYYVYHVLKGLETMHSQGLIFRDLKPENLLLGLDGEIYFADFGLSKQIETEDQLNYSICGTPIFFAPEILKNEGYSFSVDYYNVGTLAYELLMGKEPFGEKISRRDLYERILNERVKIPSHLSSNCKNFLAGLLEKDATQRLGNKGIKEIINHPWLKDTPSAPPFKFTVFRVNQIVTKAPSDIEGEIKQESIPLEKSDVKVTAYEKQISRFSFYSKQPTLEKYQTINNEDNDQRSPVLPDSSQIRDGALERVDISTQDFGGLSQEFTEAPVVFNFRQSTFEEEKKEDNLGYNCQDSEIDESSPEEDSLQPGRLSLYELNVAEKLKQRHSCK